MINNSKGRRKRVHTKKVPIKDPIPSSKKEPSITKDLKTKHNEATGMEVPVQQVTSPQNQNHPRIEYEPFKSLISLLDVIYGAVFSYLVYCISQRGYFFGQGQQIAHSFLLYIFLLLFFEDYLSVKLAGNIFDYKNTGRFFIDILILVFYVFIFSKLINLNFSKDFKILRNSEIIPAFTFMCILSAYWGYRIKKENGSIANIFQSYFTLNFFSQFVFIFLAGAFFLLVLAVQKGNFKYNFLWESWFFFVSFIAVTIVQSLMRFYYLGFYVNDKSRDPSQALPKQYDILMKEGGILSRALSRLIAMMVGAITGAKKTSKDINGD